MPRFYLYSMAAVIFVSLAGAVGATAQADPDKPTPTASIWRQPENAPASWEVPVPLETNDPRFRPYFSKVREKIKATWTYPSAAGERGIEGEAVIKFRITKDGRLLSAHVWRSSGAAILDQYSTTAVQTAAPFPPLPDDVANDTLTILSTFRYSLRGGGPSAK